VCSHGKRHREWFFCSSQHYWSEDSGIRPRSCALHRCTSFERQLQDFLFLPSLVTVLWLQRRSFNWQQWFERPNHQLPIVCVLHSQKPVALETLFPRKGGVRRRELDRGNCLRRHFEKRCRFVSTLSTRVSRRYLAAEFSPREEEAK
jgi:hypothetical protein